MIGTNNDNIDKSIVNFVGYIILICLLGGIFLIYTDHSVPDFLISLGSGGLGALSTFLLSRKSTTGRDESITTVPMEVEVTAKQT